MLETQLPEELIARVNRNIKWAKEAEEKLKVRFDRLDSYEAVSPDVPFSPPDRLRAPTAPDFEGEEKGGPPKDANPLLPPPLLDIPDISPPPSGFGESEESPADKRSEEKEKGPWMEDDWLERPFERIDIKALKEDEPNYRNDKAPYYDYVDRATSCLQEYKKGKKGKNGLGSAVGWLSSWNTIISSIRKGELSGLRNRRGKELKIPDDPSQSSFYDSLEIYDGDELKIDENDARRFAYQVLKRLEDKYPKEVSKVLVGSTLSEPVSEEPPAPPPPDSKTNLPNENLQTPPEGDGDAYKLELKIGDEVVSNEKIEEILDPEEFFAGVNTESLKKKDESGKVWGEWGVRIENSLYFYKAINYDPGFLRVGIRYIDNIIEGVLKEDDLNNLGEVYDLYKQEYKKFKDDIGQNAAYKLKSDLEEIDKANVDRYKKLIYLGHEVLKNAFPAEVKIKSSTRTPIPESRQDQPPTPSVLEDVLPHELSVHPHDKEEVESTLHYYGAKGQIVKAFTSGYEGSTYLVKITTSSSSIEPENQHIIAKIDSEAVLQSKKNPDRVPLYIVRSLEENEGATHFNKEGEIYAMGSYGKVGKVQLLEYIEGESMFDSDPNKVNKFNSALQFAHFHQLMRDSGVFNTDVKGENYLFEENGKMRVIDISNTYEKRVPSDFEIRQGESRVFIEALKQSLESEQGRNQDEVLTSLMDKLRLEGYEDLSKRDKFEVGQMVNSQEFKALPLNVQRVALYEMGLYKDKDLRMTVAPENYQRRLGMTIALAKESGLDTTHLSANLAKAVIEADPKETFSIFENADLIDFPGTPELTQDEQNEIDTLRYEKFFDYKNEGVLKSAFDKRGTVLISFMAANTITLFDVGSKPQTNFQSKAKEFYERLNKEHNIASDYETPDKPREEAEKNIIQIEENFENTLEEEITGIKNPDPELISNNIERVKAYRVKAKKEMFLTILAVRRNLTDELSTVDGLPNGTISALVDRYNQFHDIGIRTNVSEYAHYEKEMHSKANEILMSFGKEAIYDEEE